ncbi:unnamed protein product, partial [Ectocarpus sp. 12 AP-2014]
CRRCKKTRRRPLTSRWRHQRWQRKQQRRGRRCRLRYQLGPRPRSPRFPPPQPQVLVPFEISPAGAAGAAPAVAVGLVPRAQQLPLPPRAPCSQKRRKGRPTSIGSRRSRAQECA